MLDTASVVVETSPTPEILPPVMLAVPSLSVVAVTLFATILAFVFMAESPAAPIVMSMPFSVPAVPVMLLRSIVSAVGSAEALLYTPAIAISKPLMLPVVVCAALSDIDAMVLLAVPARIPVEFMSRTWLASAVAVSVKVAFPDAPIVVTPESAPAFVMPSPEALIVPAAFRVKSPVEVVIA